jgi:signal transduction histidine kinase
VQTPSELRRLVLRLYAVVGTVFCVSLLVLGSWREDPRPLAAVLGLLAAGALWLAVRRAPKVLDWIFPVSIVPVLCCAIGFVACGDRGVAYLAVMGAPVAWAAVLFERPVVVASLAVTVVTVFASLAIRVGIPVAAVSATLLSPLAGLVAWVVFVTAQRLRDARSVLAEREEKLLVATRLASVGKLASGVAHEINNPLAWVTSNLRYALESLAAAKRTERDDAELRDALEESLQGATRISSIVKAMRSLGSPGEGSEPDEIDVCAELRNAIQLAHDQLAERARLEVDLPEALPPARARNHELGRVFLNLLLNAAQAIPAGRAAENRIRVSARAEGADVVVEVADSGAGIPAHVREKIFEPFFTTRPSGAGPGLGLSIARSIVEGAGGRIEFETEEGRGTAFRVRIPAQSSDVAEEPRRCGS